MKHFIGFCIIIIFGLFMKVSMQKDDEEQTFGDLLLFLICMAICIFGGWLLFGDLFVES